MPDTYDLWVIQSAVERGPFRATQQLFDNDGGQACTGIIKLAQRWLIRFLTEKGSVRFDPTYGTAFLRQVRTGNINSRLDAITAFRLAMLELQLQLRLDETAATPADETYSGCALNNIVISENQLLLDIVVVSAAGTGRVVKPVVKTIT